MTVDNNADNNVDISLFSQLGIAIIHLVCLYFACVGKGIST